MASSSAIKGLTIEIGANTTKFTSAMKDIEKDARDISKDLKTVNENLKLDSSSAEKSADKLKLLQDAAQNASKKVDLIKQAIQKLNEQEADKSTDKYKNALADLERQLESAEREQSLANERVKAFGTEAEEAGKGALSLGDIIKGNLISGGIATGLKAVAGFFTDIASKAWEAAKAVVSFFKDYATEAINAAADYEDALGYSEQVFGKQAAKMQDWVEKNSVALRLNVSELQSYVNNIGSLYRSFGFETDKASELARGLINRAADLKSATGKDLPAVIESLTSVMTGGYKAGYQYGIVINEAGLNAYAAANGIAKLEVDELKLREAYIKNEKAANAVSKAIKEHGENSLEAREAAVKLDETGRELSKLWEGQTVELTQAEKELAIYGMIMEQTSHIAGQSAREAGGYKSQLDALHTTFDNLKISIGGKLLPVATDLITKVNKFFETDAGKAVLDAVTEAVGNLAEKVSELLQDERLVQWVQDLIDRIPELTQDFLDFTGKVADLIPKIVDLTEKALEFFGVGDGAEAARARESFLRTKDAVQTFATDSGISLEQATQAVEAFARESGTSSKNIYDNWSEYEPLIAEWYRRLADDANGTATDFDTAMEKLPESATAGLEGVSQAITNYTESDELRSKVRGWANGIIEAAKTAWDYITGLDPFDKETTIHSTGGGSGEIYIARARGGYAYANRPYLVGDDAQNRPEIYIPNTDGRILNGDQTERILNNISNNNSRNFSGGINIYVNSYGMNVAEVADELGAAFNNRIRMSGATL